jgi:hypothetical protein
MKITKPLEKNRRELLHKLEYLYNVTGIHCDLVYIQDDNNRWQYAVMSGNIPLVSLGYVPAIILINCIDAFIKGYRRCALDFAPKGL